MTPPLTLRVRIDYDGDNNADIERRIATCIARQWRVRLDDACRCSFDAVAIDGGLVCDVGASPAMGLLTEAADGVVILLDDDGGGVVTRDCSVGTLLALLGRLSVHQLSGLLVPPCRSTTWRRLDRSFAEAYAMLRFGSTSPHRRQRLQQQRLDEEKADERPYDVSDWTNVSSVAGASAPANLDPLDQRIVRVMLRVRENDAVAFEVLVLDNDHHGGGDAAIDGVFDESDSSDDALAQKLLSAFVAAAGSEPDRHAISPWNIPTSKPSHMVDPRGTIVIPVAHAWPKMTTADLDDDQAATAVTVADQVVVGWFMSTAPAPCLMKCLRLLACRDDTDDDDTDEMDNAASSRAFVAAMTRSGALVLRSLIPPSAASSAMLELAAMMDANDRAHVISKMLVRSSNV